MNLKGYIAVLLLAAVAAVGIILFRPNKEPSYHGHRLDWWVDQYGNLENPSERRAEAKEALSAIGTNAVPYLIDWIGDVDAKPSSALSPSDEESFHTRMWYRAQYAAAAFSTLGPDAKIYIPELKALVANPTNGNVCVIAQSALAHMGPDGFAAIMDVIAMPELPQRGVLMQGTELVEHISPPSAMTLPGHEDENFRINSIRAAPVLLKCLGDNDSSVRKSALFMLSHTDSGIIVPALTNFLADSPPPAVRRAAMQALAMYGTNALDAVPFLLSRYNNSDPEISIETSNTIMQIAPDLLKH